jgi:hypothetical protein
MQNVPAWWAGKGREAMRIARYLRAASLAVVVGLSACGGGGGGTAAPAVDLTGYWKLYLTPTGGSEAGPAPVFLSQTGAAVDGAAITGTVSGYDVTLTANAAELVVTLTGTAPTADQAAGNLTVSGLFDATGTFRMERMYPTGTMMASGTMQGLIVSMAGSAAIGSLEYLDPGLTMLDQVEITLAYGDEHLDIDFTPSGLAVGVLSVPTTVGVTATYRNDSNDVEVEASSGSVTITSYDDDGMSGSFTLSLPGGDTLTGTFDVSWDIRSFSL